MAYVGNNFLPSKSDITKLKIIYPIASKLNSNLENIIKTIIELMEPKVKEI